MAGGRMIPLKAAFVYIYYCVIESQRNVIQLRTACHCFNYRDLQDQRESLESELKMELW